MTEVKVSGDGVEPEGNSSQWKPSLGELLGSFQINDCLLKLIHQFLLYNEFENTADTLVHEAPKLGFNVLAEHLCTENAIPKDVCKAIMVHYITGDWKQFFHLWNNLIPQSIRETPEYNMLTFKLHLHFAILPLRIKQLNMHRDEKHVEVCQSHTIKILENAAEKYFFGKEVDDNRSRQMMGEAMEQLRAYMESDGRELEEKTELLPLFALPCFDDTQTHTTFPELFEISWLEDLTNMVQVFLMNRKQVRLMASRKTSTETMTMASLCVKNNVVNVPLTCENLKDFEDKLLSLPMMQSDLPTIPLEITQSTIMGLIPQQVLNDDMEIIPNDRNIPMFTGNNERDNYLRYYSPKRRSRGIHSKSAQTRISTLTTTTNFISTNDLCQPATILNSSTHPKRMKETNKLTQELAVTKSHLCNIQCNYEKIKKRFHKLHSDYHKLIGIAGELTAALENSVRGQAVDLQAMLESCITIFPDLFNHNIRENALEAETLNRPEVELKQIELTETPHLTLNIHPVSSKFLDYKRIKFHLINGSVKTKLLLLQALRWKLTLSQPGDRDETINEYLRGDLLGLHAQVACDSGKSILPYLLMPKDVATPHPLQQSAARLINALASVRCGRDYLATGTTLLNLIFNCLNAGNDGETIDAFTCDMIIAMLQKMSLRKQQRLYMIEIGLVEWLIFHLNSESHRIGSYRLEYATALLMNLSLHKEAQIRASAMTSTVISALTTLLGTDHVPALPYINGSLNSFLSNHDINEEAKKNDLTSILEYHREQNSGEIRKHLEHILKIHNRDYTNDTEDYETADDDNEELEVLEDELEEGDPVKVHSGELSGEALLASCYSITSNDHKQTENMRVDKHRPRTPKMHSRTNSLKSLNKEKQPVPKENNNVEMLTHDTGWSPRLTPQHVTSRGKEIVALQPNASSPVRSVQVHTIPSPITKLLPDRIKEKQMMSKQTSHNYLSVSDTESNSISVSRVSVSSTANNSEFKIGVTSKKSQTSTCSPYFCSFTRTYESKNISEKCVQPALESINSSIAFEGKFKESNKRQKLNKPSRSTCKQKFNDANSLGQSDKKLKSVRLNYSEEADNSESALCIYANASSKGSSKTTIASSVIFGTACNSMLAEAEKLSSIASLNCKIGNHQTAVTLNQNDDRTLDTGIDAFIAKPKISRTPPVSAHPQVQTVAATYSRERRVSTKDK